MSIIHEALKKAAEGEVSEHPSPLSVRHSSKWLSRSSTYLFVGFFVLTLFSSLIFLQYLKNAPVSSLSKKVESSFSSSVLNRPSSPVPLSEKRISSKDLNLKPEPFPQRDEGKEALTQGIDLYSQGKITPALEAFTKAVSLSPQSSVAHNNLGLILRREGRLSEAMSHYQEALRLDPQYAEALNNLGLVYDQLGSVDEAANYYKKALGLKPNAAAFHLNYATLLERKGDFSQAKQEYQNYLRLETDPQKEAAVALVKARLKELKGP